MNTNTINKPAISAFREVLTDSAPSVGPTTDSSIISGLAGNLPDCRMFAKSFASLVENPPEIDDLPSLMIAFTVEQKLPAHQV